VRMECQVPAKADERSLVKSKMTLQERHQLTMTLVVLPYR